MRRTANLFEQICMPENLRAAFQKASQGKRDQPVVREFGQALDSRLSEMLVTIGNGSIALGRFHQFVIRDPKERVITAPCFEERVLHHAVMNLSEPVFDRWLIDDTFACRKGKGREAAVLRAFSFSKRFGWFLKLDIRKYFDSISHSTLQNLLKRRFKDDQLLELLNRIIHSFRGAIGVGLPIGSLTSQHFANFYLGWFDRFVKESLRIRGYVRYMDDMALWHDDPTVLKRIRSQCEEFLNKTLSLKVKPMILQRTSVGVDFLGCRIWPTHVSLSRRSKRRWQRRMVILQQAARLGLISAHDLQTGLEAATSFAKGASAKSWRFRRAVLQRTVVDGP
jgi:RNA-directed DNA polymerase